MKTLQQKAVAAFPLCTQWSRRHRPSHRGLPASQPACQSWVLYSCVPSMLRGLRRSVTVAGRIAVDVCRRCTHGVEVASTCHLPASSLPGAVTPVMSAHGRQPKKYADALYRDTASCLSASAKSSKLAGTNLVLDVPDTWDGPEEARPKTVGPKRLVVGWTHPEN